MLKKFFKSLKVVENTNLNNEERFLIHKKNLENKKLLKSCYTDFYEKMLIVEKKFKKDKINSVRLELGSGVGFFKKYDDTIITSDVVKNKFTDRVLDANNLPYNKNDISTIFGIFCFHHFKDPFNFLKDLESKLKEGGLCILAEPYYGPLAKILYKKVHDSEYFDDSEKFNIKIENKTAMEKANQALSYIYFIKNKDEFEKNFPQLEIIYTYVFHNYLRFLFSGGLNFRKLIPDFFLYFIKFFEIILAPFKKLFGIHYLIVIKKK
tara:strand:+ start:685 stop:1479 length:795 start_codon:yes stop_codon:yes gene_type:complete